MMDLKSMDWANRNPKEYNAMRERQQAQQAITNAESALAAAKRRLEMLDAKEKASTPVLDDSEDE